MNSIWARTQYGMFQRFVRSTFLGFCNGISSKWILLVLKRLLEFNNFSWESFSSNGSTQLNSLIEVNQATLGISCTRTFGVSCLSFHNVIEWKFRTQHAEFRTLCWKFSTQCYWMEVSAHKGVVWRTFHLVFQHRCLQL